MVLNYIWIFFFLIDFLISDVFQIKNGVFLEELKGTDFAETSEGIDIARIVNNGESVPFFVTPANKVGIFSETNLGIEAADSAKMSAEATNHGAECSGVTDQKPGFSEEVEVVGDSFVGVLF